MTLKNKEGFTLIELLVVVAIIGILATVVLASLGSATSRATDAKKVAEIKQVQTALEIYHIDNGEYPQVALTGGCNFSSALTTPLVTGEYIGSLPEDPNFDDSSSPLLCYHYAAQHAGAVSTWTCDGTQRNAFEYTIFFTLAGSNDNLAAAASTEFTHCVTGDLK